MDKEEILKKFFDIINAEDWEEDVVFTGVKEQAPTLLRDIIIPTPHPYFFIHLQVGMEYNPELGDDLYG